ncbi:hypothetical protein AB0892_22415 [Streptomyces sp. NPDC005409]|uniref:hypothetical protein n=1 Tax=Streptomyces sp. NPDC005409 TaxID=3155342 RepID=UPI0034516B30
MDTRRGRTNRRRFLLIAGLPLLTLGGGMTYLLWPQPYRIPVRTDLEPLNERFRPHLGELTGAHWLGYDVDDEAGGGRSLPSPDSRVRLVGVARLAPGGAAAIVGAPGRTFTSAAPSALPHALDPYLPAAAVWQHSPEFDAYANRETPGARPSGMYLFDTARDLVCFDLLYLHT